MNPVDARYLLTEIDKSGSIRKMSHWENSFLESVHKLVEKGLFLSQKQGEMLQKIYRKLC